MKRSVALGMLLLVCAFAACEQTETVAPVTAAPVMTGRATCEHTDGERMAMIEYTLKNSVGPPAPDTDYRDWVFAKIAPDEFWCTYRVICQPPIYWYYFYGPTMEAALDMALDSLGVYGIGNDHDPARIRFLARAAEHADYGLVLQYDERQGPGVTIEFSANDRSYWVHNPDCARRCIDGAAIAMKHHGLWPPW